VRFIDEWTELANLPAWTPLKDVPFDVRQVEGKLFALGDTAYLIAVNYGPDFVRSSTPLATMAIWATDVGVARRFALRQIESDAGKKAAPPPHEIVAPPATYQSIVDRCDTRLGGRVMLSAEYRIAQDGAAIGGFVRQANREYCFRSVNPLRDEPVVAVRIRLPRT
jgi:hypothetical protein